MKIIEKLISDVRIDRKDELSIHTVKVLMEQIARSATLKEFQMSHLVL
jgi:hypothetical protein